MAMYSIQLDICDLIMGKKPGLEIRHETHQNKAIAQAMKTIHIFETENTEQAETAL